MRIVFSLIGLMWQAIGVIAMFNSRLGEIKHMEGVIMLLSGLIIVVILLKKD